MPKRIFYIPWRDRDSHELWGMVKNMQAKKARDGHESALIQFDGSKDFTLSHAMSADDAVYICGHGFRGSPNIYAKDSQLPVYAMRYDEVCEHLIASGLNQNFSGKIKMFN